MPMPWTYRHAGREWALFLGDIKDVMGTPSDNVAYTTAEGAFAAFRRRLTPAQVAAFCQIMPALPRALFLQGWSAAPPVSWADRATYLAEVKALRAHHNLSTDLALDAVSVALHRAVGSDALVPALDAIGPEAQDFWAINLPVPVALDRHGF